MERFLKYLLVHWGAFGAPNPSSLPTQVPPGVPSQSYSDIYGKLIFSGAPLTSVVISKITRYLAQQWPQQWQQLLALQYGSEYGQNLNGYPNVSSFYSESLKLLFQTKFEFSYRASLHRHGIKTTRRTRARRFWCYCIQ